jgi:Fucosyltransferase, N-terminal
MIRRKVFFYFKIFCAIFSVYVVLGNFYLVLILRPSLQAKVYSQELQQNVMIKTEKQEKPEKSEKAKAKQLNLSAETLRWYPIEKKIEYEMFDYESNSDTKHILFFTKFWYHLNWGLSSETITKDSPELKGCRFQNCIFTNKRNFLNQTHEYDALIFHQSIGSWYNKSTIEPIKTRSPHQLYILATQE